MKRMARIWLVLSLSLSLGLLGACRVVQEEEPGAASGNPAAEEQSRAPENAVELVFAYGSEKEEWVNDVTARFNEAGVKTAGGRVVWVKAVPQGSGELVDDLLSGASQAHLASPASAAFIKLGNAESRVKTGKDLIGETQNLVLSPVVIAMWRPMAEALGWGQRPVGWGDILQVARNPEGWAALGHPEWGRFKLGHTHPEYSNSGLISMLAEVYAANGKVAGLTLDDVRRPETAQYVAGIESSIVHYGSSTGFFGRRMFADGPGFLSAAVLYENMVIESYSPKYQLPFPVVAVYPKEGTFWSDHPVGVVEREWVTPEHREGARIYVDYLLERPQQEQALRYGFRPALVDIPLGPPFDSAHGVDPKEPQTTLEVPSVEVIDSVLQLWRANKKKADITLVLDTSGSMEEDSKILHAREGAEQLLVLLDPEDSFSFLPFNDQPMWSVRGARLQDQRDATVQRLRGIFAQGGTALYDAIAAAYDHQLQRAQEDPGRISAVVVLSDGEDTDSQIGLDALLAKVRARSESNTVRIFTIGYGKGARRDVLEGIADATKGRSYEGNTSNIRVVFREISTFF